MLADEDHQLILAEQAQLTWWLEERNHGDEPGERSWPWAAVGPPASYDASTGLSCEAHRRAPSSLPPREAPSGDRVRAGQAVDNRGRVGGRSGSEPDSHAIAACCADLDKVPSRPLPLVSGDRTS